MTKHRTISQQQLHYDVRLVFPRNNCLPNVAALPMLTSTAQRQRCLFSSVCIHVEYMFVCVFVCIRLGALCSFHSNVQREISFQYAARPASRRSLCLRLRHRLSHYLSRRRRVVVVGSLQIDFNKFVSVCREKATHSSDASDVGSRCSRAVVGNGIKTRVRQFLGAQNKEESNNNKQNNKQVCVLVLGSQDAINSSLLFFVVFAKQITENQIQMQICTRRNETVSI